MIKILTMRFDTANDCYNKMKELHNQLIANKDYVEGNLVLKSNTDAVVTGNDDIYKVELLANNSVRFPVEIDFRSNNVIDRINREAFQRKELTKEIEMESGGDITAWLMKLL